MNTQKDLPEDGHSYATAIRGKLGGLHDEEMSLSGFMAVPIRLRVMIAFYHRPLGFTERRMMSVLLVPRNLLLALTFLIASGVEEFLCLRSLPFNVFTICIAFDPVRTYAILLDFLSCYAIRYVQLCVLDSLLCGLLLFRCGCCCLCFAVFCADGKVYSWLEGFAFIRKGYAHWQRYTGSTRLDSYLTAQGAKKKSSFG